MNFTLRSEDIWDSVQKIRQTAPLIHNITNYVVMNNSANALLSLGASPVMAHAEDEVADMVGLAAALVINIGTLNRDWVQAMHTAVQAAEIKHIPIVLDPVGAGATPYRTQVSHDLIERHKISIIRGNASEIMALSDQTIPTKGVDSSTTDIPLETSMALAESHQAIVVASGPVDLVTDGHRRAYIKNGHPMMPRVTGLGCSATAIIGAFAAVLPDPFVAAAHAMATVAICGELAAEKSTGPGSLQMHFLDSLYLIDQKTLSERLLS